MVSFWYCGKVNSWERRVATSGAGECAERKQWEIWSLWVVSLGDPRIAGDDGIRKRWLCSQWLPETRRVTDAFQCVAQASVFPVQILHSLRFCEFNWRKLSWFGQFLINEWVICARVNREQHLKWVTPLQKRPLPLRWNGGWNNTRQHAYSCWRARSFWQETGRRRQNDTRTRVQSSQQKIQNAKSKNTYYFLGKLQTGSR